MKRSRFGPCFCAVVGLFVKFCFGQDRVIFQDDNNNDDGTPRVHHNSYFDGRIPESLLREMKDIQNASEFLNRFVRDDDAFELPSDDRPLSSRRNPLAGVPIIARPANCQPEQQVVELDRPVHGLQFLWPPCVRVRRCGGCCVSKALSCIPAVTSILNVTVLQVMYNPLIPETFTNQGIRTFSVEQHDRCICDCKIKAEHCNSLQVYRPNECRCICSNQELASQCTDRRKVWDVVDCMCKCRTALDCSTGSVFSLSKCRCESTRRSRTGNLDHLNTTSTTTEDP